MSVTATDDAVEGAIDNGGSCATGPGPNPLSPSATVESAKATFFGVEDFAGVSVGFDVSFDVVGETAVVVLATTTAAAAAAAAEVVPVDAPRASGGLEGSCIDCACWSSLVDLLLILSSLLKGIPPTLVECTCAGFAGCGDAVVNFAAEDRVGVANDGAGVTVKENATTAVAMFEGIVPVGAIQI